jgi:hypothetical protein
MNVYLTIDTEHSIGGAWTFPGKMHPVPAERRIFCRIGGKDYGIGWLCDELAARNLRATFFCEVFGALVFGKDDTRSWVQYLVQRGQDVQLHTHLNFFYYAQHLAAPGSVRKRTDNIADLEAPARAELLQQACELFRYAAGTDPVAYRAGSWCANRALLADLEKIGVKLDCSFNPTARDAGSFPGETMQINLLHREGGIWELPLTAVRQTLPEPHLPSRMRPFDVVSLSSWEMRKALDASHEAGVEHVVVVLHCFSGVKHKDAEYYGMRPNHVVRHRLRMLLNYLAGNRDRFRVSTCADLASELARDQHQHAGSGEIPNLGFIHPLARKAVQVVNSFYWV